MDEIILKATRREITGKKVKLIRKDGGLPGVIYGKGIDATAVTLNYRDVYRQIGALSSSSLLKVDLDGETFNVLVRERQRHPVLGTLMHIDFLAISMTERLKVFVPLELEGESLAVSDLNATIVTGLERIEVECLPQDLPDRITIDISVLKEIGDVLYVKDLVVSPKVEILTDADEMVALATYAAGPEEEEEEEVEEIVEGAEPEVVERGKKEEEEEE